MLRSGDYRHYRSYSCRWEPERDGCGNVSVSGPGIEAFVVDAVLTRLDSPELAQAMATDYAADRPTFRFSRRSIATEMSWKRLPDSSERERSPCPNGWLFETGSRGGYVDLNGD